MKELLFHNWCRREARPKSGTAWAGEEVLHVLSRALVSTLWLQGSNWTLPGPSGAVALEEWLFPQDQAGVPGALGQVVTEAP